MTARTQCRLYKCFKARLIHDKPWQEDIPPGPQKEALWTEPDGPQIRSGAGFYVAYGGSYAFYGNKFKSAEGDPEQSQFAKEIDIYYEGIKCSSKDINPDTEEVEEKDEIEIGPDHVTAKRENLTTNEVTAIIQLDFQKFGIQDGNHIFMARPRQLGLYDGSTNGPVFEIINTDSSKQANFSRLPMTIDKILTTENTNDTDPEIDIVNTGVLKPAFRVRGDYDFEPLEQPNDITNGSQYAIFHCATFMPNPDDYDRDVDEVNDYELVPKKWIMDHVGGQSVDVPYTFEEEVTMKDDLNVNYITYQNSTNKKITIQTETLEIKPPMTGNPSFKVDMSDIQLLGNTTIGGTTITIGKSNGSSQTTVPGSLTVGSGYNLTTSDIVCTDSTRPLSISHSSNKISLSSPTIKLTSMGAGAHINMGTEYTTEINIGRAGGTTSINGDFAVGGDEILIGGSSSEITISGGLDVNCGAAFSGSLFSIGANTVTTLNAQTFINNDLAIDGDVSIDGYASVTDPSGTPEDEQIVPWGYIRDHTGGGTDYKQWIDRGVAPTQPTRPYWKGWRWPTGYADNHIYSSPYFQVGSDTWEETVSGQMWAQRYGEVYTARHLAYGASPTGYMGPMTVLQASNHKRLPVPPTTGVWEYYNVDAMLGVEAWCPDQIPAITHFSNAVCKLYFKGTGDWIAGDRGTVNYFDKLTTLATLSGSVGCVIGDFEDYVPRELDDVLNNAAKPDGLVTVRELVDDGHGGYMIKYSLCQRYTNGKQKELATDYVALTLKEQAAIEAWIKGEEAS